MKLLLSLDGNETFFVSAIGIGAIMFSGLLFVIPLWRIAKKTEVSPFVSFLAFIPVVGLAIALFIMAFSSNRKIH